MTHSQEPERSARGNPPSGSPKDSRRDASSPHADPEISLEADAATSSRPTASGLVKRLSAHAPAVTRYKIEGEIARGGMGAILKVWDEDLRRTLAMKVILGRGKTESLSATPAVDETVLARFLEEAQVTGQLDHPGIVPVHELGLDANGRVYFTMRLVKGRDLKEIIDLVHAGQEGWTQTKALGVFLKVCEAMAYAHSKGVIHRDLKPANIMVGRFGETYVMDWGLAKVIGRKDTHDLRLKKAAEAMPSLVHVERQEMVAPDSDSPLVTMDGTIVGTPAYMPPEQAKGAVEEMTVRSDVYAVGAMLYHLLTGQVPYVGPDAKVSPLSVLRWVLDGPPKPVHELNPEVAAELAAISERAMARDPIDRYANTMEMANDLEAYLEGRVVRAYETGAIAEFRKWVDRNRGMAAAVAAAVVLLVLGLAVSSSLYFKAEKSAELARANKDRADSKAIEAQRNAEAAELNATRARESEKEVRKRGYASNLRAASFSLLMNDVPDCKRNLEACPEELRGWEWRHLALASDTSLCVLRVPKGQVTAVAFSPDGAEIVTGTDSGPVHVWNGNTGAKIAVLGSPTLDSNRVAFSPDGARLACASRLDGRVRIRSKATGEVIPNGLLPDAPVQPLAVAYSPDGKRLATAFGDGTVRMWDTQADAALPDLSSRIPGLPVPITRITSVAFSRDGTRVASGSGDGAILVWNALTGESLAVLRGHDAGVSSVAFTDESRVLVSASNDKTVRIWDVDKNVCLDVLRGHDAQVSCVAVSPDGSRIASASADKTVRIWNTRSRQSIAVLHGHEKAVRSVAFSPDGTRIVSGSADMSARIWDAESPGGMALLRGPGATAADVTSIAFHPDGSRIAAGLDDGTIQVWDPRTHAELSVLRGHASSVNAVAFSHDGTRLVSASSDRTVRVWDAGSYSEGLVMRGNQAQVLSAVFSPDDTRIASASEDKTALIRDAKTGAIQCTLRGHEKPVSSVAFSPDGSRVVTGSYDKTARVFDARTGAPVGDPLRHPGTVSCVVFSPDGRRLATCSDEVLRVWNLESGEAPAVLLGHDASVRSVVFSPDGTRIISGGHDNTVRLWDGRTGEALFTLRSPEQRLNSTAFSPDGTRIASGSSGETLIVWETEPLTTHFDERRALTRSIRSVEALVDTLFEELISSADVIRKLQTDSSLEEERRDTAIRRARFRGDDPTALAFAAGRILSAPDAEPKAYARALRMMETAWVERPENNDYLSRLGLAQYRAGEYEKAAATLARSEPHSHGDPRDIAFRAMAEHRIGRVEAAQQTLARLRTVMQKKRWIGDKEALAYLAETEALLSNPSGTEPRDK